MSTKTKRTFNHPTETVAHLPKLVGQYGTNSQDAVVELAVQRLFREARDIDDAAGWVDAADDPDLRAEMDAIANVYRDTQT